MSTLKINYALIKYYEFLKYYLSHTLRVLILSLKEKIPNEGNMYKMFSYSYIIYIYHPAYI